MSFSDQIAYAIALLLFIFLLYKITWFNNFIKSNSMIGMLVRIIITYICIYLVVWSALNWCFYPNICILLSPPFNYDFLKSFHIAITLTNEYSTMGFYMEWVCHKILGDNSNFELMNQLVDEINNMLKNIGTVSDDQSALSTLQNVLHLFY